MIHELKCAPDQWPYYRSGLKNSSLRNNDRNFAVGDILILKLYKDERFVPNELVCRKITHIVYDYEFSKMPKGYCLLSLKEY